MIVTVPETQYTKMQTKTPEQLPTDRMYTGEGSPGSSVASLFLAQICAQNRSSNLHIPGSRGTAQSCTENPHTRAPTRCGCETLRGITLCTEITPWTGYRAVWSQSGFSHASAIVVENDAPGRSFDVVVRGADGVFETCATEAST